LIVLFFCFTAKQKWIGYVDVKSTPVYFYVTRSSPFSTNETPIPFENTRVNEGNAMDLSSGKFKAPRPGTYFFSFTGLVRFPASSSSVSFRVGLYLNSFKMGESWVTEGNTVANQHTPLTLQWTLNLKTDDQVWVAIVSKGATVTLHDDSDQNNHFTGFMLEEDIVASL
jgi:hypothetical protein